MWLEPASKVCARSLNFLYSWAVVIALFIFAGPCPNAWRGVIMEGLWGSIASQFQYSPKAKKASHRFRNLPQASVRVMELS